MSWTLLPVKSPSAAAAEMTSASVPVRARMVAQLLKRAPSPCAWRYSVNQYGGRGYAECPTCAAAPHDVTADAVRRAHAASHHTAPGSRREIRTTMDGPQGQTEAT